MSKAPNTSCLEFLAQVSRAESSRFDAENARKAWLQGVQRLGDNRTIPPLDYLWMLR